MEIKELKKELVELKNQIFKTKEVLNLQKIEEELGELERKTQAPDFWQEQSKAAMMMEKISQMKDYLQKWHFFSSQIEELIELLKMAEEEQDQSMIQEILTRFQKLKSDFKKAEIEIFFNEPYDQLPALLSIHAGTGGTEACDWAGMLLRMYVRYSQNKGFKVEILDQIAGEEAGLKTATLEISGPYAYGYLKSEAGVHRLVRLSPFDADHARHTSFALVEVIPVLAETELEEIPEDELKIETFRSSGPGGQHAQKSESAVRITHLPTGLSVSCQSERSQYQNKQNALRILKLKLKNFKVKEEEKEIAKLRGRQMASWGNQIRSYVLHPYNMVKDHRTNYETSDTEAVLNGELDVFIEAYLRKIKG